MSEVYDYPAGFDDPGNKNAWFGRIIGEGKRVLEVGCATGYVGEYLVQKQNCQVHGIEYIETTAERAQERGCYAEVLIGDIQDPRTVAALAPGSFDFVLFGDVLEHLTSPEQALQNVAPLLAPGGHILICVPSIIHWSLRLKILRGQFEYTETGPLDRTHVHFFTPKTARDLVQGEGFRIVKEGGVVWLPSVVYKLPDGVRSALERSFARLAPNLVYGQTLLDVQAEAHA
ncbi:MAG: class I SAM-dependent methyltransferase [Janthinobacterium lividum]